MLLPQQPVTAAREVPGWSEDPLTARTRAIWTAGDFHAIARGYAGSATQFVDRLAVRPGELVLDVACGTGNLAIPAARAGGRVKGVDIAPNLIATAVREARAAGVEVDFEVGDAEALPYPDGAFETTMTMFGAMFASRPERAAAELARVTRSGGRIAMANWTPTSFVARMLKAHTTLVPPPAGVPSPLLWGDPAIVQERLAGRVASLDCTTGTIEFRFPFPPAAVTELFASAYGPTVMTLKVLESEGRAQLRQALTALWEAANVATDGTTVVTSEYLDVRALVR